MLSKVDWIRSQLLDKLVCSISALTFWYKLRLRRSWCPENGKRPFFNICVISFSRSGTKKDQNTLQSWLSLQSICKSNCLYYFGCKFLVRTPITALFEAADRGNTDLWLLWSKFLQIRPRKEPKPLPKPTNFFNHIDWSVFSISAVSF